MIRVQCIEWYVVVYNESQRENEEQNQKEKEKEKNEKECSGIFSDDEIKQAKEKR